MYNGYINRCQGGGSPDSLDLLPRKSAIGLGIVLYGYGIRVGRGGVEGVGKKKGPKDVCRLRAANSIDNRPCTAGVLRLSLCRGCRSIARIFPGDNLI